MNRRSLLKSLAAIAVAPATAFRAAPLQARGKILQLTIASEFTAICPASTLWVTEELMKDVVPINWEMLNGDFR